VIGLYIGRFGNSYWWALSDGENAYLYERGQRTKWKSKYRGRVAVAELLQMFGRERVVRAAERALAKLAQLVGSAALVRALPPDTKTVLSQLVARGLSTLPPRARKAAEEELGQVLPLLDDDG
jgi:hypothetical protein